MFVWAQHVGELKDVVFGCSSDLCLFGLNTWLNLKIFGLTARQIYVRLGSIHNWTQERWTYKQVRLISKLEMLDMDANHSHVIGLSPCICIFELELFHKARKLPSTDSSICISFYFLRLQSTILSFSKSLKRGYIQYSYININCNVSIPHFDRRKYIEIPI
jgi:hypothetical protein